MSPCFIWILKNTPHFVYVAGWDGGTCECLRLMSDIIPYNSSFPICLRQADSLALSFPMRLGKFVSKPWHPPLSSFPALGPNLYINTVGFLYWFWAPHDIIAVSWNPFSPPFSSPSFSFSSSFKYSIAWRCSLYLIENLFHYRSC